MTELTDPYYFECEIDDEISFIKNPAIPTATTPQHNNCLQSQFDDIEDSMKTTPVSNMNKENISLVLKSSSKKQTIISTTPLTSLKSSLDSFNVFGYNDLDSITPLVSYNHKENLKKANKRTSQSFKFQKELEQFHLPKYSQAELDSKIKDILSEINAATTPNEKNTSTAASITDSAKKALQVSQDTCARYRAENDALQRTIQTMKDNELLATLTDVTSLLSPTVVASTVTVHSDEEYHELRAEVEVTLTHH